MASLPPEGFNGRMGYMTVAEGLDPLQHRAEMTAKYAVRTLDMMRTAWACSACGADVPPPPAMVLPFAQYRSAIEAGQSLAQAASAAIADGGGHSPCARCGAPSRLATADLHFFSSALGRDLVARFTPGGQLLLFSWSLSTGYAPAQATPDLDRAVARDALIRTIYAKKEEDEADEGCALIGQALGVIGGDPELIGLMPWLARIRNLELGRAVADAHAARNPNDPVGHYWRAQMLVEAVAANRAPRDAIDQAVPLLQQAIALRADYPDAQIALANVARLRNDEATAESALRALLANHPEHPEANYTLGLILLPKRPADALACFERGERQAPNDADYPRSKARALLALGRVPEARGAIQRAKELAPNDPRVDQVMGEIGRNNPTAKKMGLVIKAIVAVVLLGTLAVVAVFVMGALKSVDAAKQAAVPTATAPVVAPAAPSPAAATPPASAAANAKKAATPPKKQH